MLTSNFEDFHISKLHFKRVRVKRVFRPIEVLAHSTIAVLSSALLTPLYYLTP